MAFWNKITNIYANYKEANRKQTIEKGGEVDVVHSHGKFGEQAEHNNPNINIFNNAQNNVAEIIDRRSVISQFETEEHQWQAPNSSTVFEGIQALPLLTNKSERIRTWRAMAEYPDCDFCINELADDFLFEDENGEFIHLKLPERGRYDSDTKEIIQNEFRKFIGLFNFKDEYYHMMRRFLIDGEVAYENIINPNAPDLGIIGIKYLPTEYYETIVNAENGKPMGILFNKDTLDKDLRQILSNSALNVSSIFNNVIGQQSYSQFTPENCIPLLYPQITYFSSGYTTPDGLITFSLMERCKQQYHQLAMMKDAAIILRVTRAPERLLFNINVGGMPIKTAQQMLKNFENDYKSKRLLTPSGPNMNGVKPGQIATVYNPVTMLETFFSGKTNDNDGTTVETVSSTADYDQIADIDMFQRALFKAFKVPFSRYKMPENELSRNDTMNYEEYSMSRYEVRNQRRFAMGLKRSFITHLKLRKLWDKFKMKEIDLNIEFMKPLLYDLYEVQKLVTAKIDIYEKAVEQDELSKISAMKKYLGMSDEEVLENFKNLIYEKQLISLGDFFSDKISDDNYPVDFTSPIRLAGIDGVKMPVPGNKSEGSESSDGSENAGSEEDTGSAPAEEAPEEDTGTEDETGGNEESGGEEEPSFGLG